MNASSHPSSMQELLDFLFSLHRFGIKPGLERIASLLNFLGNPQESLKCIHVAGTNGKGSVCSLLAAILQSAGYRVGLYTSPHVRIFNERIRINGEMITDEEISSLAERMMDEIQREHTTFFEVTTAMAFLYFAEQKVDFAIIETGMGGRLDATNVIQHPLATVITSIDFDHMEYLGNDLETIAGEKAGIFKKGSPVIIGEERSALIDLFKSKASFVEAGPIAVVNELCELTDICMRADFTMDIDCLIKGVQYHGVHSDRVGMHQARNIMTTLLTLKQLEDVLKIDDQSLRKGIASCASMTGILGRIQQVNIDPLIVLDVGHNVACLKRLKETLHACGHTHERWEIVFGAMKDKPIKEMLEILSPMTRVLHCCSPNIERAMPSDELYSMAIESSIHAMVHSSVEDAVNSALDSGNSVLITGSFYLADEAVNALEHRGIFINHSNHRREGE